jgi:hypothetical protein
VDIYEIIASKAFKASQGSAGQPPFKKLAFAKRINKKVSLFVYVLFCFRM